MHKPSSPTNTVSVSSSSRKQTTQAPVNTAASCVASHRAAHMSPHISSSPSSNSPDGSATASGAGLDAGTPNPSVKIDEEGFPRAPKPTDTVRRRPDIGYGAIQSDSSSAQAGPSRPAARSPLSNPSDSARLKPVRPRKGLLRKQSSSTTPYRGEIFSAEDYFDEVRAQRQLEQQIYGSRRRTTAVSAGRTMDPDVSEEEEENIDLPENETGDNDPPNNAEPEESPGKDSMDQAEEDDGDVSDAESFTLKDRQQAINQTHPFGIRLWKPALYKKDRSVQRTAEVDIHSTPGGHVSHWLLFFNLLWTILFGWWMATFSAIGAFLCFLFAATPSGREYGAVLWGLSGYLLYPFGKVVRLEKDEAYMDEDREEGRSISEYEQWQSGDIEYGRLFFGPDRGPRSIVGHSRASMESHVSETASLLGGRSRGASSEYDSDVVQRKRRLFGRGQWNIGRIVYFLFFYILIAPSLFVVSLVCFFLVFWIPMGKVTMLLFDHLRRHPLALSFDSSGLAASSYPPNSPSASVLLCTYRAVGIKYWKYTIDGTNIFLINMLAIVAFLIFDWFILEGVLEIDSFLTTSIFMFSSGLVAIIPLAYFIGQAVASISAQSSMGLGAAVNAFFSTVVEVYLYCVALNQGKAALVEGSVVGSVFAGILFLPGLSMCFGAIKRKTQRFNAKSAGVTSTMLLFAVIGTFSPTLFYQIYGTHELNCLDCDAASPTPGDGVGNSAARDCRRCFFSQTPTLDDRFYIYAVRPYCYIAAAMLFLAYIVGLWFTLRTHAAVIWNTELEEKKNEERLLMAHEAAIRQSMSTSYAEATGTDVRDTNLYKRILGQSLKHAGVSSRDEAHRQPSNSVASAPAPGTSGGIHNPPSGIPAKSRSFTNIPGLTEAENHTLVRNVAEMAATAAVLAARNVHAGSRSANSNFTATPGTGATSGAMGSIHSTPARPHLPSRQTEIGETGGEAGHGGHDAPNWSRFKSSVILLAATVAYAVIAEILVDKVDAILQNSALDEKFLGIFLFALVPNTTEFLNAISFAMNGNIALSMEIGSAYVLQVLLLQVPALVLYSAFHNPLPIGGDDDIAKHTFALIFPQWDMVTVILCVFLLSHMYGEGKSNYFKGSILLLAYFVILMGYYFRRHTVDFPAGGGTYGNRFDVLDDKGEFVSYKTVGRSLDSAQF
ncbi:hypothetical protein Cpir12675_004439 [Ceratocystis pirilliformis]|uniref:Low affinity vacuolar monovalent cation/H(+) antiporter n=1 Tax=Ceratocystis pirilliformis TaxID=259994 RepID=A0ABR3YWD7_9PEZI